MLSIFMSFTLLFLINNSSVRLIEEKTDGIILTDPILQEFIEIDSQYLDIAMYINNNGMLLTQFMLDFNIGFDYHYYDIARRQMITMINKKNNVENLLSKTIFNKNKTRLILTLEFIEIIEEILFEFNRLIIDSEQDYFESLETIILERKTEIENAIEKSRILKDKIEEYKRLNIEITQEIIDESNRIIGEIQQVANEERQISILLNNIRINNNAIREINILVQRMNIILDLLNNEAKKNIKYLNWRTKLPIWF